MRLTMPMSSAAYYRAEAERCRELADGSPDAAMGARWRQLSSEYELLAQSLDKVPLLHRSSPQPQPMQQQQTKMRDEK